MATEHCNGIDCFCLSRAINREPGEPVRMICFCPVFTDSGDWNLSQCGNVTSYKRIKKIKDVLVGLSWTASAAFIAERPLFLHFISKMKGKWTHFKMTFFEAITVRHTHTHISFPLYSAMFFPWCRKLYFHVNNIIDLNYLFDMIGELYWFSFANLNTFHPKTILN